MDDYIRRDAAIVKVQKCDCIETQEAEDKLVEAIESIPPADVRPVVRGEWRKISNREENNDYECSACLGILMDVPEDDEHPLNSFCPMCGADMRQNPGKEET